MRTLENKLKQLEGENQKIALAGCHLLADIRHSTAFHEITELEDFLRFGLLDTESCLGTLRKRVHSRSRHVKRRVGRRPELGKMVQKHAAFLRRRLEILSDRREILLQLGDGLAWQVLHRDIRRILPLYVRRTHELPATIGLLGPLQLKRELQKTGHLLALENDLTRCCGQGDLTVVRLDRPDATPLLIEVKTHAGEGLKEGASLELLVITAHTNLPVDQETYQIVADAIGGVPNIDQMKTSPRTERQAEEILASTEVLARVTRTGAHRLNRRAKHHWRTMTEVLRKADAFGSAYDVPEAGLAYFAVSLRGIQQNLEGIRSSRNRFMESLGDWGSLRGASTVDIKSLPQLSARVLPIALWEIPLELRAKLLTGELGFNTFMAEHVLMEEFTARGIGFVEKDGAWELHIEEDVYHLDEIEVCAAEISMAMTGLSPSSLVATIAEGVMQERSRRPTA